MVDLVSERVLGARVSGPRVSGSEVGAAARCVALFLLLGLGACGSLGSGSDPGLAQRAELASRDGDWDRAADLWNRVRLSTYDQELRPHLETAAALTRLGRSDEALALYGRAADLFPSDPRVPLAQGLLLEELGFRRAAELDLQRATELAPGDASALLALGRVQLGLEQARSARASLRRAVQLGLACSEVFQLTARCERTLGHFEAARVAYAQAIRCELAERGRVEVELLVEAASMQGERPSDQGPALEQSLAWASQAVETDPQSARASFVRGCLLEQAERVDEAVEAYRRTVEIDNFHLGAVTNLALIHSRRGEPQQARDMVDRALSLEQDQQRRAALRALVH